VELHDCTGVEERRRLLALLTDQRSRPWWRRRFRW